MDRSVTCIRARTSDRTPGAGEGAEALAPGGLTEEEVRALLESLRPRLVGLEVTALEHPEYAGLAARLVEAAC